MSCNNTTKSNENKIRTDWTYIKIKVDNHNFLFSSDKDSLYYMKYDDKKVSYTYDSAIGKYEVSNKNETTKYYISKSERDSIAELCYQTIVNPVTTETYVSDYAGQYSSIQMERGATQISCSYSSTGEWTSISPTLEKLNRFTFGKIRKE
jgi:hypothetical protein